MKVVIFWLRMNILGRLHLSYSILSALLSTQSVLLLFSVGGGFVVNEKTKGSTRFIPFSRNSPLKQWMKIFSIRVLIKVLFMAHASIKHMLLNRLMVLKKDQMPRRIYSRVGHHTHLNLEVAY